MAADEWRWTDEQGVQRLVRTDELRAALASSVLSGSTLVWREGMKEWAPASTMPELASAALSGARSATSQRAPMKAEPLKPPPRQNTLVGVVAADDDRPSVPNVPIVVPTVGGTAPRAVITQVPNFAMASTSDASSTSIPRAPRMPSQTDGLNAAASAVMSSPRLSAIDGLWGYEDEETLPRQSDRPQGPQALRPAAGAPPEGLSPTPLSPVAATPEKTSTTEKASTPETASASGAAEEARQITITTQSAVADAPLPRAHEPAKPVTPAKRPLPSPKEAPKEAPKDPKLSGMATMRIGTPKKPSKPPPPLPMRARTGSYTNEAEVARVAADSVASKKKPAAPVPPTKPRPPLKSDSGANRTTTATATAPVQIPPSAPTAPSAKSPASHPPPLPPRKRDEEHTAPLPLEGIGSPAVPSLLDHPITEALEGPVPGATTDEDTLVHTRDKLPSLPENSRPQPRSNPPGAMPQPPITQLNAIGAEANGTGDATERNVLPSHEHDARTPMPSQPPGAGAPMVDQAARAAMKSIPPVAHPPPQDPEADAIAAGSSTPPPAAVSDSQRPPPLRSDASALRPPGLPSDRPSERPRTSDRPSTRPQHLNDPVAVPFSSLLSAGGALIAMVITAFFVGRSSVKHEPALVAERGLGRLADAVKGMTPTAPKPCWVAKQPVRWAPKASKSIPFELLATKDGGLSLGYARNEKEAVGVEVTPKTGELHDRYEEKVDGEIERVVPMPSAEKGFLATLAAPKGTLVSALPVPETPPFTVGIASGAIAVADGPDAPPQSLWPLDGGESWSAARVEPAKGKGFLVTYRRNGGVWGGWIGNDKRAVGDLTRVTGSGGGVGKPMSAYNGHELAVIFADKPDESSPWQIRIAHGAVGKVPSVADVIPLPPGGPGGDAFAPDLVGLADGRWVLAWTEGAAGARAVRAQTLGPDFQPVGDPIALSPPAGSFGQSVLGEVNGYVAAVFLLKGDASYELWGAVLQCGG
jgi:hypothetical protein